MWRTLSRRKNNWLLGILLVAAGLLSSAVPALAANAICTCSITNGTVSTCLPFSSLNQDLPATVDSDAACVSYCNSPTVKGQGTVTKTAFSADRDSAAGGQVLNDCVASQTASEQQQAGAAPKVNFVKPVLSFDIPGLTFSDVANKNGQLQISYIAQYVTAIYRILLGVSVTVAIVMVMIGGFQYVISPASGQLKAAKTRIKNAVVGLILLLSVYVILFTINPQLTIFNSLSLDQIQTAPLDVSGPEGSPSGGVASSCSDAIAKAKQLGSCAAGGIVSPTAGMTPNCNYHFKNNSYDFTKISQVDWAGGWNAPLKAPIAGTLTLIDQVGKTGDTCGNHIVIRNSSGSVTICHMKDFVDDATGKVHLNGDTVVQGQGVGHVGGACCSGETIPAGKAFAEAVCKTDNSAPCTSPYLSQACTCQPLGQAGDTTGAHVHTTFGGQYSQVLACLK